MNPLLHNRGLSRLQEQVIEFHRTFGIPVLPRPTIPPEDRIRAKAALIAEEFFELIEAIFGNRGEIAPMKSMLENVIRCPTGRIDLVALVDALADIDYSVESCRLEFGIDGGPIAEVVHAANMAKVGGEVRAADRRVMKPPQWTPPDVEGELGRQLEGRTSLPQGG